ncbi:hypothetical protein P9112_008458 [Eukaryota sp. TZLM1-RC]
MQKYNLYPFVFSLFGSLAPTALRFLDDFEMIVKRRTGRNFNRLFWQNRIVFSIFKGMLKMVSDALLSLGSHYERVASSVHLELLLILKKNALKNAQSEVSPLDDSELYKRKKYANPLKELKHVRHVDYQICPFAISLYGRLGKTAMNFIDDFENLVKRRMNKRFDRRLWLNRIVFTIFKSIPKMISKALMSVSAHYEEIAVVRFDGVEACFEDIDF